MSCFLFLTITNKAVIQLYILYKDVHHTCDHIELPLTYLLAFPYVTFPGVKLLYDRIWSSLNYIDVVFHISVAAQNICDALPISCCFSPLTPTCFKAGVRKTLQLLLQFICGHVNTGFTNQMHLWKTSI